jgi:hypothetical protein
MESNRKITKILMGFCLFVTVIGVVVSIVTNDWVWLIGAIVLIIAPLTINIVFFPTALLISLMAKVLQKINKRKEIP